MEIQEYKPDQLIATQRMEIDIQISTAKKYPRDLAIFVKKCEDIIKTNPDIAADCNYSLTKGGKIITGPSIRLAEIILTNWGNMRAGARVLGHDGKAVSINAVAHDLESNVKVDVEVKRRITDKKGKTYSDDMVQVTSQAGISIGLRNALFKVIPNVYTRHFSDIARKAAVGKKENFTERLQKAFEHFQTNYDISEDAILDKLGVKDKRKLNTEHLTTLLGIATALRDSETTIETEFPHKMKRPESANGEGIEERGEGDDPFTEGAQNVD